MQQRKYWGSDAPKKPESVIGKLIDKSEVKGPSETDVQRAALLSNIKRTLSTYNGVESNIPLTHEYWQWINQYRTLTPQPAPSIT